VSGLELTGVLLMISYLLSIDQGTTSTRAIIFDQNAQIVAVSQQSFKQLFPEDGWVEHNPDEIWESTVKVCREALSIAGLKASDIAGVGIANQRETTVLWDKKTGAVIHNAIVWQDRRTHALCSELKAQGFESMVQQKTGLLLDPYFSATKIAWILDQVPGARVKAERGDLAFGTVDTFLLWRLTGGKSHKTDVTNASRTMLLNIHDQCWDQELLRLFKIPLSVLPEVEDCAADFGETSPDLFGGAINISGIAGDQQAALIGQACFEPGMVKSTYGTGCFLMMNTGDRPIQSSNKLLTTIAYRVKGVTSYALEGSIFNAGTTMQWLSEGLGLITSADESEEIAKQNGVSENVYMVPAFTGLGAPYWDPEARGGLFGLTRNTSVNDIVLAGLQSVAYQTNDLVGAMRSDGASELLSLRIDGGMAKNNWLVQFISDMLFVDVERPIVTETTALGVAYLAGLQSGIYESFGQIGRLWLSESCFRPEMPEARRQKLHAGWLDAVERVRSKPVE